jgi:hypothetical protein
MVVQIGVRIRVGSPKTIKTTCMDRREVLDCMEARAMVLMCQGTREMLREEAISALKARFSSMFPEVSFSLHFDPLLIRW